MIVKDQVLVPRDQLQLLLDYASDEIDTRMSCLKDSGAALSTISEGQDTLTAVRNVLDSPLLIDLAYKPDELLTLDARYIREIWPKRIGEHDGSQIVMDDGTKHKTFNRPELVRQFIDIVKREILQ